MKKQEKKKAYKESAEVQVRTASSTNPGHDKQVSEAALLKTSLAGASETEAQDPATPAAEAAVAEPSPEALGEESGAACKVSFQKNVTTGKFEVIFEGDCKDDDIDAIKHEASKLRTSEKLGGGDNATSEESEVSGEEAQVKSSMANAGEVENGGDVSGQEKPVNLDEPETDNKKSSSSEINEKAAAPKSEKQAETKDSQPARRRITIEETEPGSIRIVGDADNLDLLDDDMVVEGFEENEP